MTLEFTGGTGTHGGLRKNSSPSFWGLEPATRNALDLASILGSRLNDLSLYSIVDLSSGKPWRLSVSSRSYGSSVKVKGASNLQMNCCGHMFTLHFHRRSDEHYTLNRRSPASLGVQPLALISLGLHARGQNGRGDSLFVVWCHGGDSKWGASECGARADHRDTFTS